MNNPPPPEMWPPPPIRPVGGASPPELLTWLERLMAAPPEMVVFDAFAAAVSLGELCLTFAGPKLWREALMPYTGGSFVTPYLFGLIFAYIAIFSPKWMSRNPKSEFTDRYAIPFMMLIGAVSGVALYLIRPRVNYHNPYLTYSPWQPVWTIALPLLWALVLILVPFLRRRFTNPM